MSKPDTRRNRIFTLEQRLARSQRAVEWNKRNKKRRAELRRVRLGK